MVETEVARDDIRMVQIVKHVEDEHQFCVSCGMCKDCGDCDIWGCGRANNDACDEE